MANVNLDWGSVQFLASEVRGWVDFRRVANLQDNMGLLSQNAVYVIRIMRPYSFAYGQFHSPVAYIGKGNAQQRITSHIGSWIFSLSRKIADLKIEICFCEPRVRRIGLIHDHVEADLIAKFKEKYGDIPLRNRNRPRVRGNHQYIAEQLVVLTPGRGQGYHWAIRPLPSSEFFRG